MATWKADCRKVGDLLDQLYGSEWKRILFYNPNRFKIELAEIGWQRGCAGLNPNNLAYKMRLEEGDSGLTLHEQVITCGIALEGGSDIVGPLNHLVYVFYDTWPP